MKIPDISNYKYTKLDKSDKDWYMFFETFIHSNFKNFMLDYVGDDAEVKKLVEEKSLTYSDVQLIIKKYNDNLK